MPTVVPTRFISYEFTPEEDVLKTFIPELTRQYLQTVLTGVQSQKLALKFTPDKFHEFVQEEAYLSGQIDQLMWLLDVSNPVVVSEPSEE